MKNYANDAQLFNAYNCGDRYMYCSKKKSKDGTLSGQQRIQSLHQYIIL